MEEQPDVVETSVWRLSAVAVLCLFAVLAYGTTFHRPSALMLPAGLLLLCVALVAHRTLSSQLMVRAVLWCNLLLGFLLSLGGGSHERPMGCAIALATGVALLLIGRTGLHCQSERFSPTAYRGSLLLAMVLALADAQSLALFGVHEASGGHTSAIPLLVCSTLMIVALVGLYRLRVWGLALNIATNLLVAGLAMAGALGLPGAFVVALCTTAAVQLALPAPLLVAMVRGRAPQSEQAPHALLAVAMPILVLSMMGIAVYGQTVSGGLL